MISGNLVGAKPFLITSINVEAVIGWSIFLLRLWGSVVLRECDEVNCCGFGEVLVDSGVSYGGLVQCMS